MWVVELQHLPAGHKRTEDTYVDWVRRFVLFHGKRLPVDNSIIADLTAKLHIAKQKRQIVFASHNANIVVNG